MLQISSTKWQVPQKCVTRGSLACCCTMLSRSRGSLGRWQLLVAVTSNPVCAAASNKWDDTHLHGKNLSLSNLRLTFTWRKNRRGISKHLLSFEEKWICSCNWIVVKITGKLLLKCSCESLIHHLGDNQTNCFLAKKNI